MNMFKKNGGFTLVELIVVIAILAILAGVAIPAYSGYIKNANEASDKQLIEAVETAMTAALSMEGENSSKADAYFNATFAVNGTQNQMTVSADDENSEVWKNFKAFYGEDTCVVTLKYYDKVTGTEETALPKLLGTLPVTAPAANG